MRKTERIQQTASQNGSQDAAMMIDTCTSKYVIGPNEKINNGEFGEPLLSARLTKTTI